MKVCEKTLGCPSTVFAGVLGGFPLGPRPCVTLPETITSNEGGEVPVSNVNNQKVHRQTKGRNAHQGQDGSRKIGYRV